MSVIGTSWVRKDVSRYWQYVAISDDRKYQTATVNNMVSGQGGYIYVSTDYGASFSAMDSVRRWEAVAMSKNGQYQTAVVN
jgi:hypothetical protein